MIEFRAITLDWDNIAWSECKKRLDFISKDRNDIEEIKIFNSPLCDGYHIYISFNKWLKWNEIMRLRQRWKDDPKRIEIDLFKVRAETKMIMFRAKTRGGYKHKEELMSFIKLI